MNKVIVPGDVYEQQVEIYSTLLKKLKVRRNRIGWSRLVIIIVVVLLIYRLIITPSVLLWISLFVGIGVFLYAISVDTDNQEEIADAERMLAINNEELSIQKMDFHGREDGQAFLPSEHPYAADIDLFGKASLYQYINRCTSEQGKKLLANVLLATSSKGTISDRQEAAKALTPFYQWRQRFQSLGISNPITFATESKVRDWMAMKSPLQKAYWRLLPNIFSAIAIATLGAYVFELLPSGIFWMLVFIYFLLAKYTSGRIIKTYLALSRIEDEINTLFRQLDMVEKIPANAALLNQYKDLLLSKGNGTKGIRELKEILKRFDFRLNATVFIFLNTFLLWDVRQTNSLHKWKEKYGTAIAVWFDILANVELINTLASLQFNHPKWIFPDICDQHFTMKFEQLGHPLIDAKKRVDNSFTTAGTGKVTIITGSNMAGKSTFLRSIAVNLVLAQAGAPVCAAAFTFSPARLYSSMRIADNLAENTSTFYAELKKLKAIIDQVKQHEKVFILLDEILRGTNSLDRHTGSEALIKQLIREKAVAVIATHDVELAKLEGLYSHSVANYHFDVQVAGEELYFDYKLKKGICQSMNASILMKKIGIEVEPESND
jgi:hypothetical protein